MTKEDLIKALKNIKNEDFKLCIIKNEIELRFYLDKRDNALCVTNDKCSGFSPTDCYENTEDVIENLASETMRIFSENK